MSNDQAILGLIADMYKNVTNLQSVILKQEQEIDRLKSQLPKDEEVTKQEGEDDNSGQ